MSQRTKTIGFTAVATGCLAIAVALVPALLQGNDSSKAARFGKLVVHEWGTFTSFAGSDGVNLEYRPLVTSDLPRFVMNPVTQPGSPLGLFLKSQFYARQRMETPVTYFYTDVPRAVSARVYFPQGMLTEWYPVVKYYDSGQKKSEQAILGSAYLDWGTVRLTPPEQFADVRVRGPKGKSLPAELPKVEPNDHYGRARETDSAIVETLDVRGGSHFEKFLFYRGLGNFDLPIKLVALGNDRFEITNTSDDGSGAMLMVRIDDGRVRFTRMDPIGPHAVIETDLPTTESTVDRLAEATVRELVTAGLYEKEALAMVNTWRDSWFEENGTRLLYLVSNKLTDELLPLTITPAPDEQKRVLVGRLETITPEDSQRLVQKLVGDGSSKESNADTIKAELDSLGRFAEPAIQFVISQTSDAAARERLNAILTEVRETK